MRRLLVIAAALASGCSFGQLWFNCFTDSQCGITGACAENACAFPAADCPSQLRWDASARHLAGMCVPLPSPDLSVQDLSTTDASLQDLAQPDMATSPPDFAGVDLLGIDLTAPAPPDLAMHVPSWTAMKLATPLYDVWALDENTVYAIGGGSVYKATDKTGASFPAVFSGATPEYGALRGLANGTLFAILGNKAQTSTNVGASWTPIAASGAPNYDANHVGGRVFIFGDDVWFTANGLNHNGGFISRSLDGGATWATHFDASSVAAAWTYSSSILLGCFGTELEQSADQGGTWTGVNASYVVSWQALSFIFGSGAADMYAVGDNGAIVRSGNGGSNWSQLSPGSATAFLSIGGARHDIYVGGAGGLLLHSVDDGADWDQVASGLTTANIEAIWMVSSTNIYAVAQDGTLLHFQ